MECSRGIDDAVEILDSTAHLEARAIHHFRFFVVVYIYVFSFRVPNKNKTIRVIKQK